jgi:membrane-associated phospholipid phosphatase
MSAAPQTIPRPTRRTRVPDSARRAPQCTAGADGAPPTLGTRLAWLAAATALFLFSYGGCLWFTAQRAAVPSFYFAWERHIPYVPWMIWPYLSIDLFFLGSFFVCRRRDELSALGRRLILATVLAAACFLCFPLRYGFAVPPTEGFLGGVIGAFRTFDRPFNLAPSLHIAFRSILWVVYVRHAKGALRPAVKVWFVLVGLSTLLVYQHHVIDVVGGLFLAMLCLHLIPETRLPFPCGAPRYDVAAAFTAGAVACVVAAGLIGGWSYLSLWPALSLTLVACAYFTGDADLFRKREGGRLPRSTRIVHAPYLLGHRIAWWLQHRRRRPISPITPRLAIGRKLMPEEVEALAPTAVVDLTAEFSAVPSPADHAVPRPWLHLALPEV